MSGSGECHVLRDKHAWVHAMWMLSAAVLAASAADSSPAAAGWEGLSRLNADVALRAFEKEPNAREARFGRAVALLAKQPILAERVEEARRTFTELADNGGDDVAQGARYFLGRIAQHHQETPDLAAAAKHYRRLIAEHGESIWAQTALTRLALLELYAPETEKTPTERVASAEHLLEAAHLATAKSEIHIVMADAIFYYALPETSALPHLLAAEKLGCLDGPVRADVLVQIAEVSARTGDREQALKFYHAFLAEFPLDQRQFMVKEKLRALGASEVR